MKKSIKSKARIYNIWVLTTFLYSGDNHCYWESLANAKTIVIKELGWFLLEYYICEFIAWPAQRINTVLTDYRIDQIKEIPKELILIRKKSVPLNPLYFKITKANCDLPIYIAVEIE